PVPNPAYPRPETLHQTTTQPGPAGILPRPRNRRAQIRLRYPDLAHEQSQRARPQTHQNPTENFRPTHQRRRHPRPPRHPRLPRHRPQTRPQRPERPPRRPHRQPLVPTHPHTNLTHSTPPNTAVQHQHGGNSARPTTRHVNVYLWIWQAHTGTRDGDGVFGAAAGAHTARQELEPAPVRGRATEHPLLAVGVGVEARSTVWRGFFITVPVDRK